MGKKKRFKALISILALIVLSVAIYYLMLEDLAIYLYLFVLPVMGSFLFAGLAVTFIGKLIIKNIKILFK